MCAQFNVAMTALQEESAGVGYLRVVWLLLVCEMRLMMIVIAVKVITLCSGSILKIYAAGLSRTLVNFFQTR
jgi:hypothetical protein